ncbi:hypothetical protein HPP92_018362 [Vanilla planifolia]|uniref:Uncharacterized protein n=1 Tax=Vanilla planifolia TaxID=51239 RepID=A0A835UMW7_VANPL|nr:hypothetical protein HPP92_018973 [Vanilla planifolia]KAG0469034.1 hypothetical protein HPP92_018362 [Vanilla planifolia]
MFLCRIEANAAISLRKRRRLPLTCGPHLLHRHLSTRYTIAELPVPMTFAESDLHSPSPLSPSLESRSAEERVCRSEKQERSDAEEQGHCKLQCRGGGGPVDVLSLYRCR